MKLCIVGTGASGWMACAAFKSMFDIIMVGSPVIPSIGVGESNTMKLNVFHKEVGIDSNKFIAESDAAVKYGVYYKNWSKNDFIHNFKDTTTTDALNITLPMYYRSLANKPKNVSINDIVAVNLQKAIADNKVFMEDTFYPKSWHFDAGKYIKFLSEYCLGDGSVIIFDETVVECVKHGDKIIKLITNENRVIEADYYIFATGDNRDTNKILEEEYASLSDVLLTDKAFVYPLEYTNKREQFHPYTVAKTMKHGWRWITPTYSRIGTGYVFSSNHVSEDEALDEFFNDIGDKTIEPRLVKFTPRYNTKTFKENHCTIGMSNGFLEPLDAPGLTLTIDVINHLKLIFNQNTQINNPDLLSTLRDYANERMVSRYEFWASFILTQYKTCARKDTKFWKDHRKVKYAPQQYILSLLDDYNIDHHDYVMFMHTIAAKDQTWKSTTKVLPFRQLEYPLASLHHLDYINEIRKSVSRP